jgi:hypothetical protein
MARASWAVPPYSRNLIGPEKQRWQHLQRVRSKLNGAPGFTERAAVEGVQADRGVASAVGEDELPFDPLARLKCEFSSRDLLRGCCSVVKDHLDNRVHEAIFGTVKTSSCK